jgi:hypothetical protein
MAFVACDLLCLLSWLEARASRVSSVPWGILLSKTGNESDRLSWFMNCNYYRHYAVAGFDVGMSSTMSSSPIRMLTFDVRS